jgi:translocation protein SEC63
MEKGQRMETKDPWASTRRSVGAIILLLGWGLFAMIAYQASQFDYEMANFDPYEILQVTKDILKFKK